MSDFVPKPDNSHQYLAGILWMLLAGILFVGVTVIVRHLGPDLPAVEAAFIRYVFGLVLLLPILIKLPWSEISRGSLALYSLRGLAHGGAVMLWFFAMARIPIAEVTAIGYTTPIFTAIGAVWIFRERIYARRITAIIIGFIGMLIILRPGISVIQIGSVAQFVAAPCFAISYLFAKKLTQTESPLHILVMLTIVCTLVLLPGAILQWRDPSGSELFWLFMTAIFASAGHFAMTKSFAAAPLTVTQPVSFLQLVWAVIFGLLIFNETPNFWVIVGAVVIIASVSYLTHRESRAQKISRN